MQLNNNHSFNVDLARMVGMEKALLLGRIHLFIKYHMDNKTNYRDGRYWMYDSSRSFAETYPYLSAGSIRRWMIELEKDGWIIAGNYNRRNNDLTKWYALGPKFIEFLELDDSAVQNEQVIEEDANLFENPPVQNEQVNDKTELPVQNEQPAVQIEQPAVQNEQPLPVISSFITRCSRSSNTPATPADVLREKITQYFRHWFNRIDPHPIADVDGVLRCMADFSSIPQEKMLEIINRAFERVVQEKPKKDWVTREVLVRIRWGVEDYFKTEEKRIAKEKAADTAKAAAITSGRKSEAPDRIGFLEGIKKGYDDLIAEGKSINEAEYQKLLKKIELAKKEKGNAADIMPLSTEEGLKIIRGLDNG